MEARTLFPSLLLSFNINDGATQGAAFFHLSIIMQARMAHYLPNDRFLRLPSFLIVLAVNHVFTLNAASQSLAAGWAC